MNLGRPGLLLLYSENVVVLAGNLVVEVKVILGVASSSAVPNPPTGILFLPRTLCDQFSIHVNCNLPALSILEKKHNYIMNN